MASKKELNSRCSKTNRFDSRSFSAAIARHVQLKSASYQFTGNRPVLDFRDGVRRAGDACVAVSRLFHHFASHHYVND